MEMTPSEIGLPDKFTSFRPAQLQTILEGLKVVKSPDFYAFLLQAPTGIGKTIISSGIQKLSDRKAVYVCSTRQLQRQVIQDFPYARLLEGKAHYPCAKLPDLSAGYCTKVLKKNCGFPCAYERAKQQALSAPLAVLNVSYFLTEANYAGGFSDVPLLIFDEIDSGEEELMDFIQLEISDKQLNRLDLPPPKFKTKFESWQEWATSVYAEVARTVDQVEAHMAMGWDTTDYSTLRQYKELVAFKSKLGFFKSSVDSTWVWYPEETRWTFKPIWVSKYAHSNLWKHAQKTIGMSATILDSEQLSHNIGLTHFAYTELDSQFPVENRLVVFRPIADLSYKNLDAELPNLVKEIDRVLGEHPQEKGLCHTVSYKIRDAILKLSQHRNRLVTHTAVDRTEKLEKFKASPLPLVMVSPSMDRGVDLPDDMCRFIILCKLPFPFLGDAQVSKRLHASPDGQNWYAHRTASTIIQMTGRGVRSAEDHAVSYILDGQFQKFLDRNRSLFPSWWLQGLR